MTTKHTSEKLWRKDFLLAIFAATGISFCNYFFASALPIYAKMITGTTTYAGLMMAVYTFSALAVRPFTGMLSDRIGRTKLLILGAVICTVACLLYSFAGLFVLLILVRVLHGVGFGIHSTAGGAIPATSSPNPAWGRGSAIFRLPERLPPPWRPELPSRSSEAARSSSSISSIISRLPFRF